MLFPIKPDSRYFNPAYYGNFGSPLGARMPSSILEAFVARPHFYTGYEVPYLPFLHSPKGEIVVDEKGRVVLPHYYLLPDVLCKSFDYDIYHNFEGETTFNKKTLYNSSTEQLRTLYTDGRVYLPGVSFNVNKSGGIEGLTFTDRQSSSYYYPRRSTNGSASVYEYDSNSMSWDAANYYVQTPYTESSFRSLMETQREIWESKANECALPPPPLHFTDTSLLNIPVGYDDGDDAGVGGTFAYKTSPKITSSIETVNKASTHTDSIIWFKSVYYDNRVFTGALYQYKYEDEDNHKVDIDFSYNIVDHAEYASVSYYGFAGLKGQKVRYTFGGKLGFKGYGSRRLRVQSARYEVRLYEISSSYHTRDYITDDQSNIEVARKFPKFNAIPVFKGTLVNISSIDSDTEVIFDVNGIDVTLEANKLYAWETKLVDVIPLELTETDEVTYGDGEVDPTTLVTCMRESNRREASIRIDNSCTSSLYLTAHYDE